MTLIYLGNIKNYIKIQQGGMLPVNDLEIIIIFDDNDHILRPFIRLTFIIMMMTEFPTQVLSIYTGYPPAFYSI